MTAHITNKLAALHINGFEKRTHFGKLGKKIKVMTNFFEITNLPYICIYQYVSLPFSSLLPLFNQLANCVYRYDVNITPDVPPILNRYVIILVISFLSS